MGSVRGSGIDSYQAWSLLIRPDEVKHLVPQARALRSGTCPASVAASTVIQGLLNYKRDTKRVSRRSAGGRRKISRRVPVEEALSPRTSIRRGRGDCEDFSIATVSLLIAMGHTAAVGIGELSVEGGVEGHAWVIGRDRTRWYQLEPQTGEVVRYATNPVTTPVTGATLTLSGLIVSNHCRQETAALILPDGRLKPVA
ncbi:MAG: hypothetical protein ACRBN8_40570 [Nannocystales bacterium]